MAYFEFEVWQDGMSVAETGAKYRHDALIEIQRYARVYGQNGPIQVFEVTRQQLGDDELNSDPRPKCPHCGEPKTGNPQALCENCGRFGRGG